MRSGRLLGYTRDVLVVTAADNVFAVCVGLLGAACLLLTARWPRAHRATWWGWVGLYTLFVLYAIVSTFVFTVTRAPVTRELIRTAGDVANMRSSVAEYVTPKSVAALIGGPVLYLLLSWLSHRFPGVPRSRTVRILQAGLVVAVAGQYAYARHLQPEWLGRADHHLALSPHWALMSTSVAGDDRVASMVLPGDMPEAYLDEFLPVRDRAPSAAGGAAGGPPVLPSGRRPKHVIVYVLESTGTQFLSLYGSPYKTTPHLDAEAAHSLVYDNIYCHVGITSSSLVAINSGDFPRTVWQPGSADKQRPLNQPGTLMSQVLKEHGYHTLAITSSDFYYAYQRAVPRHRPLGRRSGTRRTSSRCWARRSWFPGAWPTAPWWTACSTGSTATATARSTRCAGRTRATTPTPPRPGRWNRTCAWATGRRSPRRPT